MFLNDMQIRQLVGAPWQAIQGLDPHQIMGSEHDPIQPASVDLTIGGIYLPGAEEGKRGAAGHPRDSLPLPRGGTAVVETEQTCRLPSDVGAIGFPPASVSARGLLTTNPGHVDPGYSGKLSFTVINMGSQSYALKKGDVIVSLLLFRLAAPAVYPYNRR